MSWPRKPEQEPTLHWTHKEPNALGQAQPACRAQTSYYNRPSLTKRIEQVSCGKCKMIVGVMQ
jgi:hypothetical protein